MMTTLLRANTVSCHTINRRLMHTLCTFSNHKRFFSVSHTLINVLYNGEITISPRCIYNSHESLKVERASAK